MQSVLHSVIGPKKVLEDLEVRVALVTGGALGVEYGIPSCRIRFIIRTIF